MFQKILQWFLSILLSWVRQPMTVSFYCAIARLTTSVPIEAVILRKKIDERIEVFLQQRKPHESYPGMWYCPGSLMRPGEEPLGVLNRMAREELGIDIMRHAELVGVECCQETRGWFCEIVYLVELDGNPTSGQWWPTNRLPPNGIQPQRHYPDSGRTFPEGVMTRA